MKEIQSFSDIRSLPSLLYLAIAPTSINSEAMLTINCKLDCRQYIFYLSKRLKSLHCMLQSKHSIASSIVYQSWNYICISFYFLKTGCHCSIYSENIQVPIISNAAFILKFVGRGTGTNIFLQKNNSAFNTDSNDKVPCLAIAKVTNLDSDALGEERYLDTPARS